MDHETAIIGEFCDSTENPRPSACELLFSVVLKYFRSLQFPFLPFSYVFEIFLEDLLCIMPRPKRKEKLLKVWLRESVFTLWKSKKDLAGYGNNTNSEFAEFLLHRQTSVSTPDGVSKKRRLEEINSDDVSPVAPSKLASTFIVSLQLFNAGVK